MEGREGGKDAAGNPGGGRKGLSQQSLKSRALLTKVLLVVNRAPPREAGKGKSRHNDRDSLAGGELASFFAPGPLFLTPAHLCASLPKSEIEAGALRDRRDQDWDTRCASL